MDLLSKILNNDADARETFEQIMLSKVAEVINNTGLSESTYEKNGVVYNKHDDSLHYPKDRVAKEINKDWRKNHSKFKGIVHVVDDDTAEKIKTYPEHKQKQAIIDAAHHNFNNKDHTHTVMSDDEYQRRYGHMKKPTNVREAAVVESIDHIVSKIANQTDENDHNGAIMTLAKHVGDDEAHKEMQEIHNRHVKRGDMSREDIDRANEIRKGLLSKVKDPEHRKRLHGAF